MRPQLSFRWDYISVVRRIAFRYLIFAASRLIIEDTWLEERTNSFKARSRRSRLMPKDGILGKRWR